MYPIDCVVFLSVYTVCSSNSKDGVIILPDKDKAPTDNYSNKRVVHECYHRLSRRLIIFRVVDILLLLSLLALILNS